VQLWNGSGEALSGVETALRLPAGWSAERLGAQGVEADGSVASGALAEVTWRVRVPGDAEPSEPYYLEEPRDGFMYRWPDDPSVRGLPRDPAPVHAAVRFQPGGEEGLEVARAVPWRFVGVDQARGEFTRPVLVAPELSVAVSPEALVWPQARDSATRVTVSLRNYAPEARAGTVRLEAPEGWRVTPDRTEVRLDGEGAERSVTVRVEPAGTPAPGDHRLRAVAEMGEGIRVRFDRTVEVVDYEHVERTLHLTPAEARITVVPVALPEALHVGYVMGTGDAGPEAIRQMGGRVTLLGPEAVRSGDFDAYDVLVIGVRAYETRADVLAANGQILDFARRGGTVVVQYQQYQFARGGYAPFPMEMGRPAPRVSDETAPVTVLHPRAPLFTTPNRITEEDFRGWSQERGLYFWGEWDDDAYTPLLEMNDPGEPPRRGSLLVAGLGEGLYVYAALSFFRQWPTGVPGAYRLFANLVSLEPEAWRSWAAGR
jgi:hypothetical protein